MFFAFRQFGEEVLKEIRQYIEKNFMGEMPVGTSFILPVTRSSTHFLVYTSTYVDSEPPSIFYAFWSALTTIHRHNLQVKKWNSNFNPQRSKEEPIRSIVTKAFWTKDSNDIASREMLVAWQQYTQFVKTGTPVIQYWPEISHRTSLFVFKPEDPEEKKKKFEKDLISGQIGKQKEYSSQEFWD